MRYEELLKEVGINGLLIKEKHLQGYKGRIKGTKIAIKKDLSETEKSCILAEELGHYYTSTGNILDSSDIRNVKQEQRARAWAYNKQIGLIGIIQAYENKCTNLNEMSEFLDVTEEFLSEALSYYKNKYGVLTRLDNYVIYFAPNLYVAKTFI